MQGSRRAQYRRSNAPLFFVHPQSLRDSSQEHGERIPRNPFGRFAPSFITFYSITKRLFALCDSSLCRSKAGDRHTER